MTHRIALLVTLAALVSACSGGKEPKQEEHTAESTVYNNIKTAKVALSNQDMELTVVGKVETDPNKTVSYMPLVSGVIDRVYFSLGEKVSKGQVLLDIRSTKLSSLQSELVALESELQISQRELTSSQALFNDGMLAEKELLEAQGKLKQAEAELRKVKSDMSVYGTSKSNGTFSIKAPESGYIIHRNVSPGSTIAAEGEALFTIADLNTVWVIANIYASNLQLIQEGMDACVTSISYPNEVFKGKINAVAQVFDPEDKALKARIILPNKDLKLKPEMSVAVKLYNNTQAKLLAVPTDALIFDNNKYYVVVQQEDESFAIKEVVPSGHHNQATYIASGLSEGEDVVTSNQLLIYADLKKR